LAETRIVCRGDSHYGRVEAMEWADDNDTFGLPGNVVLDILVAEAADCHATSSEARLHTFVSSCTRSRKVVARLECLLQPVARKTGMRQEVDICYADLARWLGAAPLRERLLPARADAEPDQSAHGTVGFGSHVVS
jgi:hypothetical protein